MNTEIPNRIAKTAQMLQIDMDTPPEQRKKCSRCGRSLPAHPLYFSRNAARADGYSSTCKQCDKENRIKRGVSNSVDLRTKDPTLR